MLPRTLATVLLLAFVLALPVSLMRADESGAEASLAPSASPCADKAVGVIQSRYRETRDLRAKFRQVTRSVAFGEKGQTSDSKGMVQFAKPGKMRWSYTEPDPSLLVSDGSVLWLYDPVNGEAQYIALSGGGEVFSGAGVRFLLDTGIERK